MNKTSFLKAASGKINPSALLSENEDWLRSYKRVIPLLDAWKLGGDKPGGMFPTPALTQICQVLVTIKETVEKAPLRLVEKPKDKKAATPVKTLADASKVALGVLAEPPAADPLEERRKEPYIVTLYIKLGENGIDIGRKDDGTFCIWKVKDHFIAAERLAARRLFEREDSTFAVISRGGIETRVERQQAFYLLFPKPHRTATKKVVKTSANLGNYFRCKQTQARFSGC
jgi:hypothetical protein